MGIKNNNQKKSTFSFLRIFLLALIIFCCLFLGHYCLNSFYYKTIRTNSGLTYWIVPYSEEDDITATDINTNGETIVEPFNTKEDNIAAPFDIMKYKVIIYQREISYRGKIIEHGKTFKMVYANKNGGVTHMPYIDNLKKDSLDCIDGDYQELLMRSRPGVVLEGEILATSVLKRDELLKHRLYKNSKVYVKIFPIEFCYSNEVVKDKIKAYDKKMQQMEKKQMEINKKKIASIIKKKAQPSDIIEFENGYIAKIGDDANGESISENDMVTFDCDFYNLSTGELILSTTLLPDKKNSKSDVRKTTLTPLEFKMQPKIPFFIFLEKMKNGGQYEVYTSISPEFFGDTTIYLFKIKIIHVEKNKEEITNKGQEITNEISNKKGKEQDDNKGEALQGKKEEEEQKKKENNENDDEKKWAEEDDEEDLTGEGNKKEGTEGNENDNEELTGDDDKKEGSEDGNENDNEELTGDGDKKEGSEDSNENETD